jgi:hypothetical protein
MFVERLQTKPGSTNGQLPLIIEEAWLAYPPTGRLWGDKRDNGGWRQTRQSLNLDHLQQFLNNIF